MFEDLPSQIRSRFENRPDKFLDFVNDENNQQEMVKMGLLDPIYQYKPEDISEQSSEIDSGNTEETRSESSEKTDS